jgi:hypothetical protein
MVANPCKRMVEMSSAIPTANQWQKSIKSRGAVPELDRCTVLVRTYHLKPGTDTAERQMILDQMIQLCAACLKNHGLAGPLGPVFFQLGTSAQKEKKRIQKASKGWGSVRRVFKPSKSPHGPAIPLTHRHHSEAEPTSLGNYWLEALDPRHRSWGHQFLDIFNQWMHSDTTESFWDWLEKTGKADVEGVQYLAPDERWKYWIIFDSLDKCLYRHDPKKGARGNKKNIPLSKFTTRGMSTAHSGRNFAIWVCSPTGVFYSDSHIVSKFHHSSFLGGGRVLAAGEWVVSRGIILLITHKTGHYGASPFNLYNALRLLNDRTDLQKTVVQITDYSRKLTQYIKAVDFLAKGGNASQCHQLGAEKSIPYGGYVKPEDLPVDMAAAAQKLADRDALGP